jgi:hypothetical protein
VELLHFRQLVELLHFRQLVELLHFRQLEVVEELRIDLSQYLELREDYILLLEVVEELRIDLSQYLVPQEGYKLEPVELLIVVEGVLLVLQ